MDSILSYTPDKTSLLQLDFIAKIPKWVTGDGKELVEVGSYDLGDKTKKKLGGEPHYGNRALLTRNAARAFREMQEAYGKDIPISSAYRDKKHNKAVGGAKDSDHMRGNVLDIGRSARDWVKKHGSKYGWGFATYPGNKWHFEYKTPKGE
tara:strand:+ start:21 stop:470 length:450 start_codon:yes stop_codon:yes gene_type:complete